MTLAAHIDGLPRGEQIAAQNEERHMTTLADVCRAWAVLAMAEYDDDETVDQLRAERDRLELQYKAAMVAA